MNERRLKNCIEKASVCNFPFLTISSPCSPPHHQFFSFDLSSPIQFVVISLALVSLTSKMLFFLFLLFISPSRFAFLNLQISANFHFTDCFPKCFFLLLPVCNHSLIVTHHFVKHLYAVSPGISFLFNLPFTFSSLFLHHTVPPLHQSLSFHSISFYSFKIYLLTQFFLKAHTQKAFEGTCTTLNNQIQNDQHALYMYRDFVPFSLFRLLYLTLRNFKQIGALSHWVCDNHRLLVSIPLAWDC